MCKKCESNKNKNKSHKKQSFNIIQNPNYSVEINNGNFYNSTLEVRNDYQKSIDLYAILMN
jgi:hypothetical protein